MHSSVNTVVSGVHAQLLSVGTVTKDGHEDLYYNR